MFVLGIGAGTLATTTLLMSYVSPPQPTANIRPVVDPYVYRAQAGFTGRQVDRALVRVDGTADFTSCFTWNTKQVYVFFVVEYSTAKYSRSEITIHDTILTSKDDAVMTFNKVIEYPTDHIEQGAIAGKQATLKLKYHIMTYSGLSPQHEIESAAVNFTFPSYKQ